MADFSEISQLQWVRWSAETPVPAAAGPARASATLLPKCMPCEALRPATLRVHRSIGNPVSQVKNEI